MRISLGIVSWVAAVVLFAAVGRTLAAPPNDNFANREAVPYQRFSVYGTNYSATVEEGEPFVFYLAATVWYSWTAPFSGSARLSVQGLEFFTPQADLLVGNSFQDMARLATVEENGAKDVQVVAGTTYHIRVGTKALTAFHFEGSFSVTLLYNPPVNDNFAQRTAVSGTPLVVTGNNLGSTEDNQDPPSFHELSTVWYSWVAPSNGSVNVTISSTNFDPVLHVYAGNELGSLSARSFVLWDQSNRFEAVAGTEYQIRIAGNAPVPFPKPEGVFTFRLSYNPGPANDAWSNRTLLIGDDIRFQGSTVGATHESNEPFQDGECGAHSVWYSWRAPDSGVANFSLDFGYYPTVNVYAGNSLINLQKVAGSGGATCCFSFTVTSNGVYQIAIDACFDSTEDFGANLRLEKYPKVELAGKSATGYLQLRTHGQYFGKFTIEASSNLMHWIPIFTNSSYVVQDDLIISDPQPPNWPSRFYRAVLGSW
jgi:hypothetical protein